MTRLQKYLTCLCLLAAMIMVVPATALAGSPSAGDQQYIDPLGGTGHKHGGGGSGGSGTPSGSTSSSSGSATSSSTSPTATTASSSTTAPGTATTATGTSSSATLPRTGFDAWEGGAIGLALLATGLIVRRRAGHSR